MALNPQLAQKLFEDARWRKPEEYAAYLQDACPGDPQLRDRVLRMLTAEASDPGFLETSVLQQILTSPLLEPDDVIDGRFRILRLLGAGGMGEVYEAVDIADPDHPEHIALKTIRRSLAGEDEVATRLRREVHLIHKVSHANVCKVHYLGVDKRPERDLLFLTMDLLEGETLAQRIARSGRLSTAAALSIAEQIAAGLDAAHAEGVIHRDLKSSNIMLVPRKDGTTRAIITDFGIASRQEDESAAGAGHGTAAYMAPERWSESGATPASDLFSFGVILYEMVTGRLPFESQAPFDRRQELPPTPSAVHRGIGRKWDAAIVRCLHPAPEKRFARASDAVDAIRSKRWPLLLAAGVVLLILAVQLMRELIQSRTAGQSQVQAQVRSVAILPFRIGAGAEAHQELDEYLANQIQRNESIRQKWFVFSPRMTEQVRVTKASEAQAVLGASHVLTGTVRLEGGSLSIAGDLLETRTLRKVGGFRKSCSIADSVCLQDGMLGAIAAVLVSRNYSPAPSAPMSGGALQAYLQGMHFLRVDSESAEQAIPFLTQAIALDKKALQPRIALADAYMLRYRNDRDKTALDAARQILEQTLTEDPGSAEAHASMGALHRTEGRHEDAVRHLLIALQADPSNHSFHRRLGMAYDFTGHEADAISEFEKAIMLHPGDWSSYLDFAVFHHRRGRFPEAARLLETFLERAPEHAQVLAALGGIYVDMGRNDDAERVSSHACSLRPARSCYTNLGLVLQRQRKTPEAIAAYNQALNYPEPSAILLLNIADAHAYTGNHSEAARFFRATVQRAQEDLTANPRNDSRRALLAYCLANLGEFERAANEIEQALQGAPKDKTVRKYAVLTWEKLGKRERSLKVLREGARQVLEELELGWGIDNLRQDPRYREVAQELKNK